MILGRGLSGHSAAELAVMRRAGQLVGETLQLVARAATPGITTAELDALAHDHITAAGATPSFLGYPGGPGAPAYPGSLCLSTNEEIVHGLPGTRVLREGDLLSVDCGAIVDGWHGDAALSVIVGGPEAARSEDLALLAACEESMWAGIGALRAKGRLYDVGAAVEDSVEASETRLRAEGSEITFGIVEDYTGHGIGREMHLDPEVYNYRVRGKGPIVPVGLTVCIEPMLTLGGGATVELDDRWTVVSADRSRAAHFEHTVAVMAEGLWVLTALDGGRAELEARGLRYAGLD